MRITLSDGVKLALTAGLAAVLVACGGASSSTDGAAKPGGNPSSAAAGTNKASQAAGCNIQRPNVDDPEGAPFTDIKTDVLMSCGWPEDQVGVMGRNATYWLSPFNGRKLIPEGTCMFWVYNAQHTTSYVDPRIMSKSKITIRASYMGADGHNNGFAPGSVTVDDIYQVTPKFVLSLRDNKHIDLSKCGKTTPAS